MLRRLVLALALLCVPVFGFTACEPCEVRFLNGPGNHPPGGAYFADIQTWYTVVGGQLNLYGYSRTINTVIYTTRECANANSVPDDVPKVRPVLAR